jgi:hypothetical protein
MKKTTLRILAVSTLSLASLLLTQCIVVDPSTAGGPSYSSPARPSSSPPSGYGSGFEKGFEDGRNGLSRTPDRYGYIYSQADRSDFFRGYEAGYNKGIR